jgi:hypothetical protein
VRARARVWRLPQHLFDELEQVRSEKEAAVVAKEQQAALHAKALSEEVMAARSLLLEKVRIAPRRTVPHRAR